MYTPRHFEQTDRGLLLEVMRANSFGLLVGTNDDGECVATHLPFVISERGGKVLIEGHMAHANPHWRQLERDPRALVVFSGPHCYVSPSLYESPENVPTWNYIAVHAYGPARLIHDRAEKIESQQKLIATVEPGYRAQFEALNEDYLGQRLSAIVALEIAVERLEGKFKLSQNRPDKDRRNVMVTLAEGGFEERQVARWMQRLDK
jgi:transcriptional regulator